MRNIILIAVLSSICCLTIKADDKPRHRHLTLEQSIEIAKEKSYRMLKLEQNLKQAEYDLQSTTKNLKTHVDLELGVPRYSEDVRDREDSTGISYYSVKQLAYDGNLTINQPLPTDGRIYVQNVLSSYDDFRTNMRSTQARTRIGIEQPLDAFYGYNEIRSRLKRAKLNHERSSKSLKREELNLIYDVSSAFYNLLSVQKRTEIAYMDFERQTDAQEISKNKFAAGLIREVDALQMEVDLAEAQNNYDIALLNQTSSVNSFKELLGINLHDSITIDSQLTSYTIVSVDPTLAIEHAMKNRLEIREQEIQIELQKLSVKQQKAAGMIKASINAHYEQVGVDQTKNRGLFSSVGSSYRNYNDRPSNFGIGFTIKVPVFDWGENRAKVKSQESRLQEIRYSKIETERSIEVEVINLVASANSDLKRLQLLEKNVNVAEKSFDITLQRYTDGEIDSQTLSLERTRLNTAYTSHLNAYIQYQLSLANLMRKTFYDFLNNKPID